MRIFIADVLGSPEMSRLFGADERVHVDVHVAISTRVKADADALLKAAPLGIRIRLQDTAKLNPIDIRLLLEGGLLDKDTVKLLFWGGVHNQPIYRFVDGLVVQVGRWEETKDFPFRRAVPVKWSRK